MKDQMSPIEKWANMIINVVLALMWVAAVALACIAIVHNFGTGGQ